MKIIAAKPLPADVAQVTGAKEFQRSKLSGLLFGKSRVQDLKIERVEGEHGPVLVAKVKVAKLLFFSKWETLGQSATDAIAVRHIDLAVATKQVAARPVMPPPSPAATAELKRSHALRRNQRSASLPSGALGPSALKRSGAIRRTASDPGPASDTLLAAGFSLAPTATPVLTRQASVASLRGEVGSWEEASSGPSTPTDFSFDLAPTLSTVASSVNSVQAPERTVEQEVAAYIRYMADPEAYGTDLEIHVLAQLTGKQFHVVNVVEESDGTYAYERTINGQHPDQVPAVPSEDVVAIGLTGSKRNSNDTNGNHYVPLKDSDTSGVWNEIREKEQFQTALGGGACLFDSVAQKLQQDGVDHLVLRAAVAAWFKDNAMTGEYIGKSIAKDMRDAKIGEDRIVDSLPPSKLKR